jgi:TolB protein
MRFTPRHSLRAALAPIVVVAVVIVIACMAGESRAQGATDVRLRADQGVQRIVLDVPVFPGDAASDELLRRVIRDDLFFSGLFEFVPPGSPAPYRLEGMIEAEADQHVVTVTLLEIEGTEPRVLAAKRYRGQVKSMRRVAHRIAEDVVAVFTGQRPAFDTRIAFVSNAGDRRDIHVMDYDGANAVPVTKDGAIVLSPEVSPDGQMLIFTSYVSRLPAVYVVRRDTGEIRKLLAREGLNQSPSFSPDGQKLALAAVFDGNSEIYVSDLLGKSLRRLTDSPAIDVSPAWSPGGQELAFCSDRAGTPQIYVMSADGLEPRRITRDGAYNSDPAWSPDGTMLAHASRQAGRFQVAIVDVATGRSTTITDGMANYESPCWSPDGEFLAVSSDRDGKYDIWVMRKDGSALRRVGSRGENRFPFWYR